MNESEFDGEKYSELTFAQINLLRPLVGNFYISDMPLYILEENKWIVRYFKFTEALVKIFDEIITNASDAASNSELTNEIRVTNEGSTIVVENNGPGLSVYKKDSGIYSVEQIFTREYSSSNYGDKDNSTTGGLNGMGAKIASIYSEVFTVETVCTKQSLLYKQTYRNNISIIEQPIITPGYHGKPFTRVTFKPDFDKLCRISADVYSQNWISANVELLKNIIFRRCSEIAVYTHAKIYFNSKYINGEFMYFVSQHGSDYVVQDFGNLKVAICFFEPTVVNSHITVRGFQHVSIFNGLSFRDVSNYVSILLKKCETFIKTHSDLKKYYPKGINEKGKVPERIFRGNITIITVFKYPRKHVSMRGNEKMKADLNEQAISDFEKTYDFSTEFYDKLWSKEKSILSKLFVPSNMTKKIQPSMYIAAHRFPAKALVIVEGNSAATLIETILEYNKSLSKRDYGIFSTKGVPMNAIKASRFFPAGPLQTKKLCDNIILQSLITVLGLNYEYPERPPRYNSIIISTDQDLDGIGKICSLIICFLVVYFPALVKSGFIKRLRTPIIRVYPKDSNPARKANYIAEYYSESDFENIKSEYIDKPVEIRYYKGLAQHSLPEVKIMAQSFESNLISIVWDSVGYDLMFKLYGDNTELRKTEITQYAQLIAHKQFPHYKNDTSASLLEHFSIEALAEQLNNISRMMPDIIDGLKPCSRKILATARLPKMREMKANALAGRITDKMGYFHGESSLNVAIMACANTVVGACIHPILEGVSGSIGSRRNGKETGAARYTLINYNPIMNYYFPKVDDDLLKYIEFEGERFEPIRYYPIVPRIIIEHNNTVATGWNHYFVGRNFDRVMKYIRLSIRTYPKIYCTEMLGYPASITENMRIVIDENDTEICLGKVLEYRAKNKIVIKELPLHISSKAITKLCSPVQKNEKNENGDTVTTKYSDVVRLYIDNSAKENVLITIIVNSTAWEIIDKAHTRKYMSAVEEFFGLYKIFHKRMNFMDEGKLIEYTSITPIFSRWFEERRALYVKRIEKNNIRKNARVAVAENQLHYISYNRDLIYKQTKLDSIKLLNTAEVTWTTGEEFIGYHRIMAKCVESKIPCQAEELKQMIYPQVEETSETGLEYLLDIKDRQKREESIKKLRDNIKLLHADRDSVETWEDLWLSELDELEKAIKNQNLSKI